MGKCAPVIAIIYLAEQLALHTDYVQLSSAQQINEQWNCNNLSFVSIRKEPLLTF